MHISRLVSIAAATSAIACGLPVEDGGPDPESAEPIQQAVIDGDEVSDDGNCHNVAVYHGNSYRIRHPLPFVLLGVQSRLTPRAYFVARLLRP
jgi:hypothetical protein